jgi:cell division protein FtsQ
MSPDDAAETRQLDGAPVIVPEAEVSSPADAGGEGRGRPHSHSVLDEARRRRLRPWAIAGAVLVVLVTGSVALSYTSVFGARVVEVEGEERLTPRRVMLLAGVAPGTNVLHLDARLAEARLEDDPWIRHAAVETSLPGTITISVRERSPVLVLGAGESRRYVAGDGTLLGDAPRSAALPRLAPLPGSAITPKGLGAAGAVARAMSPGLRRRVDTIVVAEDGTVSLVVDGGVEVRYGAAVDTTAKAQALAAILQYADEEDRALLEIDVSAPAASTARFVGSQQPSTAPDPSADVASDDAQGTDDEGNDGPGASPSSSP